MSVSSAPPIDQFRSDIYSARHLVERLYPDEEIRFECLRQLAESIRIADDTSPSSWGVTLHDSEIRLNVGFLEALVLRKNALALTIQKPVDEAEWLRISQAPELTFKWNGESFKSMESAYGVILETSHFKTLFPRLTPLHIAHVKAAAQGVKTLTNFHKSHSSGVMELLRHLVNEELPDPDYSSYSAHNGSVERRYWKISPGQGAKHWEYFQQHQLIAIGWDDKIDLRTLEATSKQEFAKSLKAHPDKHPHDSPHATNQLWTFFREMQTGDWVCTYGNKTILGWGEIIGEYDFEPVVDMAHQRKVHWQTTEPVDISNLSVGLAQKIQLQSTIIPLTNEEFEQITGQIVENGPDDATEGEPNDRQFAMLLEALNSAGLSFSTEIVSNYLLALQTKRFVILTGISGTGKTQLALAAARHFQQSITVPHATEMPDGTVEFVVQPTYLKRGLMVLPTAFVANLVNPPTGGNEEAKKVRVEYPDGAQVLTLSKAAAYNVTRLFFSGAFREWFLKSFSVGDRFTMELVEPNDNPIETLRIHVPTVVPTTELLKNYEVCAVRPDWSDNRGLLGYFNPLIGSYVVTPFLRLLLDASEEVRRATLEEREPAPFFVILDEMNLARVEHYFSDFLSALESGEPIHLHDHPGIEEGETEDAVPVPRQLRVPGNVFFTGTVNVDETTYMFSPKVLDRAFTIELNRVDLGTFGTAMPDVSSDFALKRFTGSLGPARKPSAADWVAFGDLLNGNLRQVVLDLHTLLSEEDRHFGYRVANEIARFVVLASEQTDGSEQSLWTALDLAVLEKVLPKYHGTQQELESVLSRLIAFISLRPLPRTASKIESMQRRLQRQGFTSFIE